MAGKKRVRLTKDEKISLTLKAAHAENLPVLQRQIETRLAVTGEEWKKLTEEHKEIILYRLSGGDTVLNVCKLLGIDPGPVYMARQLDDEFAKRYDLARAAGAHALVDAMREVSRDETLTENSKSIELKALQWIASRLNRKDFGDQVQVQHNVTPHLQAPDWMGSIIEGQIIPDPSSDPSDTDEGDTDSI